MQWRNKFQSQVPQPPRRIPDLPYIVESVSVIAQVFSFKYRKKRIFKMAPLHHHFEMKNWAETTVIVRFWIISTIFVIIAVGLFYLDWVLYGGQL